jgi:hypothetical protein
MTPASFGAPAPSTPAPSFGAPVMQQTTFTSTNVTTGYGGKMAPPPAYQPEI